MTFTNDTKPTTSYSNDTEPSFDTYLVSKWDDTQATWDSAFYGWSWDTSVWLRDFGNTTSYTNDSL